MVVVMFAREGVSEVEFACSHDSLSHECLHWPADFLCHFFELIREISVSFSQTHNLVSNNNDNIIISHYAILLLDTLYRTVYNYLSSQVMSPSLH